MGCIYGLVALGFVLIYKATELVNFAQGDLLMLGAFVCYMAVVWWGLDYWAGLPIAVVAIGAFGALLDAVVLRRVIGQPQFAVVMLTIGLGAMFRTFASVTWGSEIYTLPTPFGGVWTVGGVTLSHQYLSIVAGTLILCGVLYAFFNHTRIGVAMQATSQNQLAAYYMGIPVKLIFSLIWAISAGVAAAAGILLAPVTLIDINMGLAVGAEGLRRGGAGRLRLDPRRADRRHHHRPDRALCRRDPARGLQGHRALHRAAADADRAAAGPVRHARAQEGVGRSCVSSSRPPTTRTSACSATRSTRFWYGLLAVAVVALPLLLDDYSVGEISWVFIYGICGVSLMVLVGYTGLVSLGHAAFLGIGAYAHAYFIMHGAPWIVAVIMAVVITTACGLIVGLPALRMTGIYLAIATLAFSVIIQEVFSRWESVTHGFAGMKVDSAGDLRLGRQRRPVLLLPLPVLPGDRALADAQPAARADRPRLDRHPRQRDRRPIDGRQPRDLQVDGLRLLGRSDGPRRRPVRAQDRLISRPTSSPSCCRSSSCCW